MGYRYGSGNFRRFVFVYMKKKYTILKISKDEWKLNGSCIARLCGMGIPMGLQYSITAIGSVVLQTAVNRLGSTAVAAVGLRRKTCHVLLLSV